MSYHKSRPKKVVEAVQVSSNQPSISKPPFACWKCDKIGPRAADCRTKLGVMCYKCKTLNVTLRTCPKCAKKSQPARKTENTQETQ